MMILVSRESPAQKAELAGDAQTNVPLSYVTWAHARERRDATSAAAVNVFIANHRVAVIEIKREIGNNPGGNDSVRGT